MIPKWLSYCYFNKTTSFSLHPRIGCRRNNVNVWMSIPRCAFYSCLGYNSESGYTFCLLSFFLSGRDEITNMTPFLFSAVVGLKSLFVAVYTSAIITLSPFLMNKDRNHTYFWKYGWSWKWTIGLFLSHSRSSFLSGCITPLRWSCTPKKGPKFLYFSSLLFNCFWPFSCVSAVQRHVGLICIVLI